jgi:hypothetical protein
MELTTLALLVLAPLLVWRVYTRVKSMMARQRSILARHYTGLGVFAAMALVAGSEVIRQPIALGVLVVGTAMGIGWGIYGFRRTRLEETSDGCYFTPHMRLGLLIAMLFTARILYAGFELYAARDSGLPPPRYSESLTTQLTVGLMAGYFGAMSALLIAWRRKVRKAVDLA